VTEDWNPVGVLIPTSVGPQDIAGIARTAEELGFGSVWVAEECYAHGGFAAAAIAMEIATLARAFPGRFLPGIGHGVPFLIAQMGLTPSSVLAALAECVLAVRALLAGETVRKAGRAFVFDSVQLRHPVDVPVLTGVIGPRSLRLSGRIADGTVLSVLAGTRYVQLALREIRAGMAEGDRTEHLLPTFALSCVDNERARARSTSRPVLGFYLSALGNDNPLVDAAGHHDAPAELLAAGEVTATFPDEWIDDFSVSGTPDEAERSIRALLDAGATSVVLMPTGQDLPGQLRFVAETVLPRFVP
jgi:alkanesulfonate monooxygenase SsuD/methylene tetrahydromethanopterin reductase-like flavin-dependent oxidoreductase (luciferase family)